MTGTAAAGTCQDSFDVRSGMMRTQCSAPFTYDAAGRQISNVSGPPPNGYTGGNTLTRKYDAENHVISTSIGSSGGYWASNPMCAADYPSYFGAIGDTMTYGFGPNGHPIVFTESISGQSPYPTYAHWDGDSVLFTNTGTSGIDFKVGKLSFNGGEIIDRDLSGQQAATHDPLGFSAFNVGDPMHPAGACKTEYCSGKLLMGSRPSDPQWTDNSSNELLKAPRADGYSDGTTNVFQGVRAFDNTAGQWTAPDAYAGDVNDPMSQKPFMWNRNNPLKYEDPSGYEAGVAFSNEFKADGGKPNTSPGLSVGVYVHVQVTVANFSANLNVTAGKGGVHAHVDFGPSVSLGPAGTKSKDGWFGSRAGGGVLQRAIGGSTSAMRQVIGAPVKATSGASVTGGILLGLPGQASSQVYNSARTASFCGGGACVEGGVGAHGSLMLGGGVGSPGISLPPPSSKH